MTAAPGTPACGGVWNRALGGWRAGVAKLPVHETGKARTRPRCDRFSPAESDYLRCCHALAGGAVKLVALPFHPHAETRRELHHETGTKKRIGAVDGTGRDSDQRDNLAVFLPEEEADLQEGNEAANRPATQGGQRVASAPAQRAAAIRVNCMIQFVSQAWRSRSNQACSQRAPVGVIPVHRNLSGTGWPWKSSVPRNSPMPS